ncbi:MAG: AMP-dependent synthetase [Desulfobacca sp. 4484_104]|nr:MAG: AMP-dependent synthetase [Desulfobacca sp. 4484_104]RLB71869.1 MAG: AMP-dependent synthetase [Deltaproteobacteria bacterium]
MDFSRVYTFTAFEEACQKYPERNALIYLGRRFSYRFLKLMIDQFTTALHRLGIGHQDKVMIYLGNSPQWIIANFAIQKLGAVVVPVSPIYTSHELLYMVKDAGVETVICMDTNFGYVKEVDRQHPLKRIIVTNLTDLLYTWQKVFGTLVDRIPRGSTVKGENIYRFNDLLRRAPAEPPEVEIDACKDLAYIMYTGGTTGFPKGVPGSHVSEVSYVEDVMEVFRPYINKSCDTMIMVNPLFHIMAKGFLFAAGLNFGNTTVLMPVPEVDAVLREIERFKVRWMLGVPALYRMILENDRLSSYDISSLEYCYCGGDVLPGEIFNRWRELTSHPLYQVYGSTEVGHLTYSRLDKEPDPRTVGSILPSRRCLVVDPETLEEVDSGAVGELLVTSVYTNKSYWNKPEETNRSYVRIGDEIFYRMGDYVRLTENGEIQFVERTADTIKYKAYRISASEIEAALQDHPTVMGACVVGIPDAGCGERIKAIVVLKEDAKGVDGQTLTGWCRKRLAPYKIPHYIEFRDMLPKSKVGKLLRREIRDEEKRKEVQ